MPQQYKFDADCADWGETPQTIEFNRRLSAIVNEHRGHDGAREAEDMLLSALADVDEKRHDVTGVVPSSISFNHVMRAWGMVGKNYAAERAEQLLRMQEERSRRPGQEQTTPTVYSFSAVINAYANSGRPDKAETVLRFLVEQYQAGNEKARPNRIVFNTIVKAWAKSNLKGRESRSEDILRHMITSCAKDDMCPRPDKVTFNIVLGCYAKSSQYGSSRKAVKLLKEMEELDQKPGWRTRPDAITHLLVIQALGRERTLNAAEMALDLLHKLQGQYIETRDEVIKPNKIHFNAVINGFANTSSRQNGGAKRAEDVLKEMHDLYYTHNQYDIKPDRVSYSSAITGYANEGRPLDAERILGMMIEEYRNGDTRCKPDTIAYTSVINSWAQSGEPGAAQRATEFLGQMEKEAEHDPDLRPTKVTYGCAINAYANEGSGEMAAAILHRMEQLFEAGDKDARPDKIAYNMVLKGFADQRDVNAPQRAEALYRRMEQLHEEGRRSMKPDVLTVNSLLKCWVTNDAVIPSKRILGLLGNMLSTSEKRQRPNDETFDLALRVLLLSGDAEAVKRVESAWKKLRGTRGAASVKPYRSRKRRTPAAKARSENRKDDEVK
mmetsp:Transcript_14800/g.42627  ORF Transcript_14800/g.42627 Transcript_14800/m.42627 type:complete len:609 (+) Transcript_14800:1559-3385(+)